MELLDVMKKRFSVRKYKEQQVEPEKLAKILEAAHVAPTATNAQPVRLIVVQSEEGRAKLEKLRAFMVHRQLLSYAPITIKHGCANTTRCRRQISMLRV